MSQPVSPSLMSFDSAIALTGMSKRTLWRRLAEGALRKSALPETKTRLLVTDVLALAGLTDLAWNEEMQAVLLQADAGEAGAQTDLAQWLMAEKQPAAAARWLQHAADQGYPDAMHCLGQCYATGSGLVRNENLAVMWIAKAAAAGHVIAAAQMGKIWQIL